MRTLPGSKLDGSLALAASIFVPAALALLAASAALALGGRLSLKFQVAALAGTALVSAGFWTGKTREMLVAAWVFTLTYNRQYFVLDPIFGAHGAQSPYLILSDIPLLLLYAQWILEGVFRKAQDKVAGARLWPYVLPFAVVSLVSAAMAVHPLWSLSEVLRLVRIGLILFYFQNHATADIWLSSLAGLFGAVGVQASLGTIEVLTGRSGILGVLGLGSLETAGPQELRQESFYGWRRATATMSHPPNLACYLMMGIPPAFALALTARRRGLCWIAWAVTLAGMTGLVCTLSRWPLAVIPFQLLLLAAGLVVLRLLSVRRFAGLCALGGVLLCVSFAAFADRITDRLSRDFDRSVEFRLKENATGIEIFMNNPVFGVGPNNYREYLLRYRPEWEWAMKFEEFSIRKLHIRPIAAPHNGFLLIAAETGVMGLLAFLLFCFGAVRAGLRALALTCGEERALSLGMLIGLLGLALQQFVDFSIWADPLLYTLALYTALLNMAPAATRTSQGAAL